MVGKKVSMFRATTILATLLLLVAGGSFVGRPVSAQAPKALTPEQIAEIAIAVAGAILQPKTGMLILGGCAALGLVALNFRTAVGPSEAPRPPEGGEGLG